MPGKPPNVDGQVQAAQSVAAAFAAASSPAEKHALALTLKAKLDAIVWDD